MQLLDIKLKVKTFAVAMTLNEPFLAKLLISKKMMDAIFI
jgi:hypothetical protein